MKRMMMRRRKKKRRRMVRVTEFTVYFVIKDGVFSFLFFFYWIIL